MALTPLAAAVLGLLTEHPMHPYEMFQLLVTRGDIERVKVRPGTLYHTVDRLQKQGLVRAIGTDRAGNRPERTTYELTDEGQVELQSWVREAVAQPVNEFPAFRLAVAEMHNLPAAEVMDLIEVRISRLRAEELIVRDAFERTAGRDVPERFVLDLDFEAAALVAQREWLERLLRRLRSGDIDWPAAEPSKP